MYAMVFQNKPNQVEFYEIDINQQQLSNSENSSASFTNTSLNDTAEILNYEIVEN